MLAGCLLGPSEAALLGLVFGLSSMWKASVFYVKGGDMLFSPLMSGTPFKSIMLSVGARVLFGLAVGLLYRAAKRGKYPIVGIFLVSYFGNTLHAVLVYAFMGFLFPEAGFGVVNAFNNSVLWNFVVLPLIQNVIILTCYTVWQSEHTQAWFRRIRTVNQMETSAVRNKKSIIAFCVITFLISGLVALYFVNRLQSVMKQHGVNLSSQAVYDINHLQIQFLLGIVSLFILFAIVIILYQKNFNYIYHKAKQDDLTGLLSREQFFYISDKILDNIDPGHNSQTSYFIILDIDNFKSFNDKYGHPAGDKVLREVADCLRNILNHKVLIGRLGGDEFVALSTRPMTEEEMKELLSRLKERIARININGEYVTCSIGAASATKDYTIQEVYRNADRLLYEAKKNGKNQIVF